MHDMLPAKKAAGAVQNKSMQAILEPIGVDKTDHEAAENSGYGIREESKGDACQYTPGGSRCQEVISLDSQPLGFRFRPNYVIRSHAEERVTLAVICRKRARPGFGYETEEE